MSNIVMLALYGCSTAFAPPGASDVVGDPLVEADTDTDSDSDSDSDSDADSDSDSDADSDADSDSDADITDDFDGDGFGQGEDCDDGNPDVYPGAPELCDGILNNCNNTLPTDEYDLDWDGTIECAETSGGDADTDADSDSDSDADSDSDSDADSDSDSDADSDSDSDADADADSDADADADSDADADPCVAPLGGTVPTLPTCEFAPSAAGTPFSPRIEWSMSHQMIDPSSGAVIPAYSFAQFPDVKEAMQAPAVLRATDDNYNGVIDDGDIPDIAVVMSDVPGTDWGVLRLISGDGSQVFDSVRWEQHSNANGTHNYAPYNYSGLAMGDIDWDPNIEIATMVVRQTDGLCFPAIYEVDRFSGILTLDYVYGGGNHTCSSHAPAMADIDNDGSTDLIFGRSVLDNQLNFKWLGTGGRGWYNNLAYTDGYWNSGTHSFAYDMDGDGYDMEVVAGSTVYNSDGSIYCELGRYISGSWVPAADGYPSVADLLRFPGDYNGEPEIVVTGNEFVSVFHGVPDYDIYGQGRCTLIDSIPNAPEDDPDLYYIPSNPNCLDRPARGGPSTIADFDGDGANEIGVAGSCWYSVYEFTNSGDLRRFAYAPTLDYSSASTGSTVFDFNGDGRAEVVFSDEEALYVWSVDSGAGLSPHQRLDVLLYDDNHKSWTIHEYPIVADVDNDGKAEIVMVNASNPSNSNRYGIYVLGAADDDWVTARSVWNQHAYYVTNIFDDGYVDYGWPNYMPYDLRGLNSFRQQAPGEYGAAQAPNLTVSGSTCQEGCDDPWIYLQVANNGAHVSVEPGVVISIFGESGGVRTSLASVELGEYLEPGQLSEPFVFRLTDWNGIDNLIVLVDDPAFGPVGANGQANECNENDNEVTIGLSGLCP